jgi:hypothetical protein
VPLCPVVQLPWPLLHFILTSPVASVLWTVAGPRPAETKGEAGKQMWPTHKLGRPSLELPAQIVLFGLKKMGVGSTV